MKVTQEDKKQALERLQGILQPGDTIYTTLKHRARSGMYRVIDLYVIKDNEPIWLSYSAGILLEGYDTRHEGAKGHGCGMDVGYHLVHNLGRVLFPNSFICIGENCPSNDHSNGDRDYTPHLHSSGGYAFHHKWL